MRTDYYEIKFRVAPNRGGAVVAMRVDDARFLVDVTDMSNNFGRTLYYNACLRVHESGALAGAASRADGATASEGCSVETNCSFTPRNAQLLSNSTDFVPQPDFDTAVLATGQRSWNLRLVPNNGYVLDATSVSRDDSLMHSPMHWQPVMWGEQVLGLLTVSLRMDEVRSHWR